ncbi:phosphoglycolate phosphatase/AHBA synthesis associated protein [Actinoplanes octamycinicus]|uniref:Phosphoglycolate phosphatase/AHBA synthesis associated protein n=1 Tax=Actinoplanes octamycinicus TaxID=135948 RepID=A0A7W7MBF8_9ACTN|nr:HAD family hydrolase [Actinoplanes octamycinicus]MBB4743971.1 phosphoglycolate phosphatase/AHBA synthesis associated protein [Actinoplanes octamycinicus]GIE58594.1 phosphoglycolate phosphatase [Actinoplanes octamycinicus]
MDAVVFDMDGTLIESTTAVNAAFRAAVAAGGGPWYSDAEIVAAYPLGPPQRILDHLLGRPATPDDLDRYYAHLGTGRVSAYDGIGETLADLTRRCSLGVFTGASQQAAQILLGAAGLLKHFSIIVGGDQVANPKPAPDGILRACEQLGVAPGSVAYVGDSPLDLQAARRSGAVAVAAAWGHLYDAEQPADRTAHRPADLRTLVTVT